MAKMVALVFLILLSMGCFISVGYLMDLKPAHAHDGLVVAMLIVGCLLFILAANWKEES